MGRVGDSLQRFFLSAPKPRELTPRGGGVSTTLRPEPERLFGRDALLAQICAASTAITFVAGESGVGKSAVLAHAASRELAGTVSVPPQTLRAGAASLQRGLLDSLSAAVVALVERDGALRKWQSIAKDAAKALIEDKGRELGMVVAQEFLGLVKARLGPGAGDALAAYLRELQRSADSQLAQRIRAASDPGVIASFCLLADEVHRAAKADLLLSLDGAENLDDADWRLLQDLAEVLPAGVRVRMAVSTSDPDDFSRLQRILPRLGRSATVVEVIGLDQAAVAEWMDSEELDRRQAFAVTHATQGSCLHVGDLIHHLKSGGRIESFSVSEREVRWSQLCWQSLDPEIAAHARRLACFRTPPPHDRLTAFLGLSEHDWGEARDRLRLGRIFTANINGRPWFHELRRQAIWQTLMSDEERRAAAHAGLEELTQQLDSTELSPELELAFAELASADEVGRAADETLDHLCLLTRDELAVASALIELAEPTSSNPAVLADELLLYAYRVYTTSPGLLDGLNHLQERGLVAIAERDAAAAVVPVWVGEKSPVKTPLILKRNSAILLGRAQAEFQRVPLPSAATNTLDAVLQGFELPFRHMQYRIGWPGFGPLAETAFSLGRREAGPARREAKPSLLIRAQCGSRLVSAVATMSATPEAEAGAAALRATSKEIFGERVAVHDVTVMPESCHPSMRLIQAVRLLEGLPPASSHQAEALKLDEAISWDEYLEFASKSAVAFATIVTPHEAEILGLSDVASYLLGQAESYTVVAQVRGAEPGVRRVDMEGVPYQDPYLRFKLTSAWQLRRGEELGKITWHDGSPLRKTHAMMDLALAAAKEARAYNRRQHRVPIEFDPDQIGASLDQTLFHRAEDALTIATSVGRTACERRIVESRTAAVLYCNPSTMRREGVGVNWLVTSSIYTLHQGARTRPHRAGRALGGFQPRASRAHVDH